MALIFFTSLAVIAYTYLGYPLLIWAMASLRRRLTSKRDSDQVPEPMGSPPSVSVVIACHNEANAIEKRLDNLLGSRYPRDLLEIVVVSDGSTDETLKLARQYSSAKVVSAGYSDRNGKAAALNLGVRLAVGSIVVFADARQSFAVEAIEKLISAFDDDSVGAVSGELVLREDVRSNVGEGAGLYWKYEKWIRKNEARFDSCVGATGAIFAIRRELWSELPTGIILDDVYTPMRIALSGHRIAFEEGAKAYDGVERSAQREFSRKVRTLFGNYQLCQLMPKLLLPNHRLAIQFYSHKILRLIAPLFLVLLFASNLYLCASASGAPALYIGAFAGQIGFYLSVLAGWALSGRKINPRLLNAVFVFSLMNVAAIVGLLYFVRGKRDVWVGANRR
ncbi:MAG TPA: glycosyltransferase family 2 protein [Blastocatellia bacterium]|nr:glycosyltransferase family 2 protein [Blastocatellia bacterium]